jgi:hypothetical protein
MQQYNLYRLTTIVGTLDYTKALIQMNKTEKVDVEKKTY